MVRTFILEVATKRNFFPGRLFGHPLRGEIISSASNIVSIGIDLGGTTFNIGWLTGAGRLEHVQEFETKSFRPRDEIVADLAAAISSCVQAARDGDAEFKRFLTIAYASASELDYHLLLARDLNYIQQPEHEALQAKVTELRRMLHKFIQTIKTRSVTS